MTTIEAPAVDRLWTDYRFDRRPEAANALVVHYLPLVRFAALRLTRRLQTSAHRRHADVDDLMQLGALGLRSAIAGFDPGRGIKFETYSARRIHGAMLDGLKSQEWAPRDERKKLAAFAAARADAWAQTGGPAPDETIAARVGVCPSQIRRLERAAASLISHSLGAAPAGAAEEDGVTALLDERAMPPDESASRHDLKQLLLHDLTRGQRLVLILHYYEQMTMREIGATLGVSATRVSQLHTEAMERLRRKFQPRSTRRDAFDL